MAHLRLSFLCCVIGLSLSGIGGVGWAEDPRDKLWSAARSGDGPAILAALEEGVDINARSEIGVTALWIAAGKNKPEIVRLLIEKGADVNARDGIWYQTPLSMAMSQRSAEIVRQLVEAGAADVDDAAAVAVSRDDRETLKYLLATGRVPREKRDVLFEFLPEDKKELREILQAAGAEPLARLPEDVQQSLQGFAGRFENDNATTVEILASPMGLRMQGATGPGTVFRRVRESRFDAIGSPHLWLEFEREGELVSRMILHRFTAATIYYPAKPAAVASGKIDSANTRAGRSEPMNWPQFRGPDATGVADGQSPPVAWNLDSGENVRWKTAIPGLGHSCPVVWGDRIFLTTAISGDPNPQIRTGNYGDVESVDDTSEHTWHVVCVDKNTGELLWNVEVHRGVPKIKRHLKGSQANCTIATDGKHVVACFGPEGLYCLDVDGNLQWSRDLSAIDSSFAIDQEYEWGFGSSPLLFEDLAIVQFDLSHDSFIAGYRLEDGSREWATDRDEIPSWSSPTLWRNSLRTELVTNAAQYARSYDPRTGQELWRLAKKSEVTVPAPVPSGDLLFIVSGNRPIQPIIAIKPGGAGDISLEDQQTSNDFVAWSRMRGGPYMPTPIVYGEYLYVCSNAGIVTCYQAETGKQVYRERMGGDSYTASPVAADGRLYFVSEQGEVRVVRAGPEFELLSVNAIGEVCMTVPAISDGRLYVRSQHFLWAFE